MLDKSLEIQRIRKNDHSVTVLSRDRSFLVSESGDLDQ